MQQARMGEKVGANKKLLCLSWDLLGDCGTATPFRSSIVFTVPVVEFNLAPARVISYYEWLVLGTA